MAKLNIRHIPTKKLLIDLLFKFHNSVNKKLGKPTLSEDILKKYSNENFQKVITVFINIFSRPVYNTRLMTDNLNRNFFIKGLINYFQSNLNKYEN